MPFPSKPAPIISSVPPAVKCRPGLCDVRLASYTGCQPCLGSDSRPLGALLGPLSKPVCSSCQIRPRVCGIRVFLSTRIGAGAGNCCVPTSTFPTKQNSSGVNAPNWELSVPPLSIPLGWEGTWRSVQSLWLACKAASAPDWRCHSGRGLACKQSRFVASSSPGDRAPSLPR